ncbi:SufS family cysteine desulfurase [Candidatus Dojkabacteria bacterium]|nr:SufS family cysteine desulfurase [Candidatus Dojkabacteria bacterium]
MDQTKINSQFPILKRKVNGKRLVYLDNAATTQKPDRVIDALKVFYSRHNSNIHRGLHTLSVEASDLYEGAHDVAAEFIGAKGREEVVFTRNTTESINLVANAWGRKVLRKNDIVVISEMEHHSNIIPWMILGKSLGIRIERIPVDNYGKLDLDECYRILTKNRRRVKLLSIVHVSNVLGTVNPVKQLSEMAHDIGALFMLDAAQSAARVKINVEAMGVDFLALSSHKMYGPTGIGVLYAGRDLMEEMDPWMGGGDMVRRVTNEEFEPADLPWKFEAGTPNIADGVVYTEAIRFIQEIGLDSIAEHERQLISYAMGKLQGLGWVKIYGPQDLASRMGVISFTVDGVHPHDLSSLLDDEAVAIRAGHHCAMPLHIKLGTPATARISFAVYNTKEDIDAFVEALKNARSTFLK